MDELTKRLAETLRRVEWVHGKDKYGDPIAWCPWCGRSRGAGHDRQNCRRQDYLGVYDAQFLAEERPSSLPWDPASACDAPEVTKSKADPMLAQTIKARKRYDARDEAKLILSYFLETVWEKMGCKWTPRDSESSDAIIDAILTAAGA